MGLIIESLVAALLVITIAYCVLLNRRLKGLRMDEATFRKTIGDLLAATEAAAQGVASLKRAVAEKESALAERVERAAGLAGRLDDAVTEGGDIIRRLGLIATAARPVAVDSPSPTTGSIGSAAADLQERLAAIRRRQVRDVAA